MNQKVYQLFREIKRRIKHTEIFDGLFPEQQEVFKSKKKKKAILTSRRAGKSWIICSFMLCLCLTKQNAKCLYLALTFKNVKRIAFDIIKNLCQRFDIEAKFNKVNLTVEFPKTQSIIELDGAAGSNQEVSEKYLGTFFDCVAIDEAGSFDSEVLNYLINTVIKPTLIDRNGTLILAGTPRSVHCGTFFEVTTQKPDNWDIFSWNTIQNPHMSDLWKKELAEMRRLNPDIDKEPWFIRDYLGQWCKDESDLVYSFNSNRNLIAEVEKGVFSYFCGLDFGWAGSTAFTICGWKKYDNNLYVFESFKKPRMLPDAIAKQLSYYQNSYAPLTIVGDTSHRTVVEEINNRYSISILNAEKTNKIDWIQTINSEFTLGRIRIIQDKNPQLIKEITKLPWKVNKSGSREEHPAFENHLCDSLLYGARYAYNYREKPREELTIEEKIYQQVVAKFNREQAAKKKRRQR